MRKDCVSEINAGCFKKGKSGDQEKPFRNKKNTLT